MWSAIIGDIIGSTFEVENHRSPYFEFFRKDARFTDDTVCTVAVADILQRINEMPEKLNNDKSFYLNSNWVSQKMRIWCCTYLTRGFGSMFYQWIANGINKPYYSYGNGALMRISPVAYYGVKEKWSLQKTIEIALDITNITHNHPDAQKAVSCYIDILYNLLSEKKSIDDAKDFLVEKLIDYGFGLPLSIEYYKLNLEFDLTCNTSLLVACAGVLEANSYDDVFSLVVSSGGDTDTYCAIAGPLGESIWGLDLKNIDNIKPYFREYDKDLLSVMTSLYS
jgi:ADP-ribosyl-[dinitrogen reductase] hydrolase